MQNPILSPKIPLSPCALFTECVTLVPMDMYMVCVHVSDMCVLGLAPCVAVLAPIVYVLYSLHMGHFR